MRAEKYANSLIRLQIPNPGYFVHERAWNFGPDDGDHADVITTVKNLQAWWKNIDFEIIRDNNAPHEANMLKLDCSKARSLLGWKPVWNSSVMLEKTAAWYREFYESGRVISHEQLTEYIEDECQDFSLRSK